MLREYQSEKRIFENEQIDLITNRINYTPFKNFILFGLYTGCRLSEILNLEWTDIDLNNRTITIRNKVNFKTKSGKIRRIPISDKLLVVIKEMNIITHGGYIFRNELDLPFTKDAITKRFKNILKNAALPDYFHFHCLRHTFITNLIKKGVSIYLVKELAGHADIKTTIGYTHIVTDDLRDAVNML